MSSTVEHIHANGDPPLIFGTANVDLKVVIRGQSKHEINWKIIKNNSSNTDDYNNSYVFTPSHEGKAEKLK